MQGGEIAESDQEARPHLDRFDLAEEPRGPIAAASGDDRVDPIVRERAPQFSESPLVVAGEVAIALEDALLEGDTVASPQPSDARCEVLAREG